MRSQVTNLTDTDMRDLAAYFAAQTPTAGSVAGMAHFPAAREESVVT
jgi:cytochrome c553